MWKTKLARTKLIVKIYNFKTDSSPAGLFPFPSKLKLTRPLAKTTAQQVKPLTQKVRFKMSKKCNNVKGGKDADDDELFFWYG